MNFLTDDVKKLYFKFLTASIMSALVVSIYAFVDTIAVGQSEGPMGTAAMAVITPLYGVFGFFSLMCGIGGSVLMSKAKGEGHEEKGNAYFTAALMLLAIIMVTFWVILGLFHKQIFRFFGADDTLMGKVMEYARWMLIFFPAFITPSCLGAFIRNDGAPQRAMMAVIAGGSVNVFGDWFFVFPMGMGMEGAAIATVAGVFTQICVMSTHFFGKRCKLKLCKPKVPKIAIRNILKVGFCAGVIELGTVIIAIFMNNQIMKYGGTTELAVYGVIVTIFQLFSAMFSGVGQAIQPLVSSNYGAGNHHRNAGFWKLAFVTVLIFGGVFTAVGELFPVQITRVFIDATPEVIHAAPGIFRRFFLLYLVSGVSVLSIYYLQSTMRNRTAVMISVLKGAVVSGVFIMILPIFMGIRGVWLAMPCSEFLVAMLAYTMVKRGRKPL